MNVARLRKARGLTLRTLADRLASTDRPLSHNAISEIERGARRVDVDDLMALAYALEANPNCLLVPPINTRNGEPEDVAVTGIPGRVPGVYLWQWLDGARPLFNPNEDAREFTGRTRPAWRRTAGPSDALRDELNSARLAMLDATETLRQVLDEQEKRPADGDD